jgi:hypothetical protein|tara:strand:+ start:27591 stop:27896 length:306 start_codon:yes stop_codon:yes gene_type:complete
MALSRYSFASKMQNSLGQNVTSISNASPIIFRAVESQVLNYSVHILEEGERLDYLAGIYYGDSSFWWVLAAASGIGYALQVPPGTVIRVPNSIAAVFGVLV